MRKKIPHDSLVTQHICLFLTNHCLSHTSLYKKHSRKWLLVYLLNLLLRLWSLLYSTEWKSFPLKITFNLYFVSSSIVYTNKRHYKLWHFLSHSVFSSLDPWPSWPWNPWFRGRSMSSSWEETCSSSSSLLFLKSLMYDPLSLSFDSHDPRISFSPSSLLPLFFSPSILYRVFQFSSVYQREKTVTSFCENFFSLLSAQES